MMPPKFSVVKQKSEKKENRGNFLRCLFGRLAGHGRKFKEPWLKGIAQTSGNLFQDRANQVV